MSNEIDITKTWLKEVIFGLSLCPFVGPGFKAPEYYLMPKMSPKELKSSLNSVINDKSALSGTYHGLHIYSECSYSFEDFYHLSSSIQGRLRKAGVPIDVICFHPNFHFAGLEESDRGNFVNRSPYPMLHAVGQSLMNEALSGRDVDFGERVSLGNNRKLVQMGEDQFDKKVLKYQKDFWKG